VKEARMKTSETFKRSRVVAGAIPPAVQNTGVYQTDDDVKPEQAANDIRFRYHYYLRAIEVPP
jgi:hypothetical protein